MQERECPAPMAWPGRRRRGRCRPWTEDRDRRAGASRTDKGTEQTHGESSAAVEGERQDRPEDHRPDGGGGHPGRRRTAGRRVESVRRAIAGAGLFAGAESFARAEVFASAKIFASVGGFALVCRGAGVCVHARLQAGNAPAGAQSAASGHLRRWGGRAGGIAGPVPFRAEDRKRGCHHGCPSGQRHRRLCRRGRLHSPLVRRRFVRVRR